MQLLRDAPRDMMMIVDDFYNETFPFTKCCSDFPFDLFTSNTLLLN